MLLYSHRKASQTYQFVDSSHRHSLASYLITGRIKMAFLVFTGTYMRTIMWPTVWRTALSQLYLCIWDGCWKIIHLQGKNQRSHFITEVTIIFCWFFGWLFATFFFHACTYCLLSLGVSYDDALAVCCPMFCHLWSHIHAHIQALGMCSIFHAMVGYCRSREGMHRQGFPVGLL